MILNPKTIVEKKCSGLGIFEKRMVSENYCEIVLSTKDRDRTNEIFEEIFGKPLVPTGYAPGREAVVLTKEHGGIRKGQKLYRLTVEDNTIIALFWPWSDSEHVTVKIAVVNTPALPEKSRVLNVNLFWNTLFVSMLVVSALLVLKNILAAAAFAMLAILIYIFARVFFCKGESCPKY